MRIRRTANAGVLLELDGQRILLDGVCGEVAPYYPTPMAERLYLQANWPDAVAFTHAHADHWDIDFAQAYYKQTLRPILGPESLPVETCPKTTIGSVSVQSIPTRHLGRAGEMPHVSFLISGSKNILFTGDATPLLWRSREKLPKIHAIICPYAYATTAAGWQTVRNLAPETVVLVHFPPRNNDPFGLWDAALASVNAAPVGKVYIPGLGQTVTIREN